MLSVFGIRMTSGRTLPKFTKVDESNIQDHARLVAADQIFFLFEYTSRANYSYSKANSLIANLKKRPSRSHLAEYGYKAQAMHDCAAWLAEAINPAWLNGATLVPVPPSRAHGDPDYDDRISRICQAIPQTFPIDVRELVVQTVSTPAAHEGDRPAVEDLLRIYQIDETLTTPAPLRIAIVDDVLTAGTHYRAMHTVLSGRFPGVPIVGMFIARRVFPNPFAVDIE